MTQSQVRTAVITGGSSGLGLAMASHLAREGFTPVLLARSAERLAAAVESVRPHAPQVLGIECDVTSEADLQAAARRVREALGGVHFLILNAGAVRVGLLEEGDVEDLRTDIETDLWGTVLSARTFLPLLRDGAKVLCISSGFGLMGAAGYTSYCAAKAGVVNFAAALRRELLHRDCSVYVACPSDMDTPQFEREQAAMPNWMRVSGARGKPMPPAEAARKILARCRGRRFLVIINLEIRMLLILQRLLPLRWAQAVLDRMFPVPPKPGI